MEAIMFKDYPDILNTRTVQTMLGLCKNSVLDLLRKNEIRHFRKGRKYLIPKKCVIEYVSNNIDCAIPSVMGESLHNQ